VPLRKAVEDAALVLRGRLDEKRITLDLDVDPEVRVWAEHRSLASTVIANLLTNAIKFSPPGSPVHVRAEAGEGGVRLTIRDHGVGIAPAVQESLFDVRRGRSRPGTHGEAGSGFGLPLVKKFVTLYGGRIEVSSREPQAHPETHGTDVRLLFQAAVPAAQPAEVA
jgi:signal transduction histidine kinase